MLRRDMRNVRSILISAAVISGALACSHVDSASSPQVEPPIVIGNPRMVDTGEIKPTDSYRIVQFDDGRVAAIMDDTASTTLGVAVYHILDGEDGSLQWPMAFECSRPPVYLAFENVSPDEWMFIGKCYELSNVESRSYLVLFSEKTRETRILHSGALPIFESSDYSFDPKGDRVIVGFGSLFSGMYWFDSHGATPVTGTATWGKSSFELADAFDHYQPGGYEITGDAKEPVWSPTYDTIAFLANTNSTNLAGPERLYGPWQLCFIDYASAGVNCKTNVNNLPIRPCWSPDGRYVLIGSQESKDSGAALWIYSLDSNRMWKLADGLFYDVLWTSDATQIVTVRAEDDNPMKSHVWIYDVTMYTEAP